MKLTVTESVSLDGVMQGLGGPDGTAAEDSNAADGRSRSGTRRAARSSTTSTRGLTRSCSDAGRTRSSPAPGAS
jgi:hypothetical protein